MDTSSSLVLIFKDLSSLRNDSIVIVRLLTEYLICEPSALPAVSIETSPPADLRSKRELEIKKLSRIQKELVESAFNVLKKEGEK